MRFDLADLRLFLAVVDAGSITHGAVAANLSLAAASERLRDMEAASGVSLLNRGRRGVAPTRAGDTLAHHARLLLRQVGAMQADLSDHALGFRGSVRVLANSGAIAGVLAERLGPFLAAHRNADVELSERSSSEIVRAVSQGLAEIGIVSDAVDTSPLSTFSFAADRLVLAVPRDHRLAGMRRIAFADTASKPMVAFDGPLQAHVQDQGERIGLRVRPRVRLRNLRGVCRMVADGAGIAVVPELAPRRASRTMPLTLLHLTDPWASRQLLLCCQAPAELTPLAQALLRQLVAQAPAKANSPA